MPSSEVVPIRVPLIVPVPHGADTRHLFTDEVFDVPIAVADEHAPVVATVSREDSATGEALPALEYRLIEGRLFRPVLSGSCLQTPASFRECTPSMVMADYRPAGREMLKLLSAPFAPHGETPDERTRARVRKRHADAIEAAREGALAKASKGLRIFDSLVYQETRTPAYEIRRWDRDWEVDTCLVDDGSRGMLALIDPRHDFEAIRAHCGYYSEDRPTIEVREPSLLPPTVEIDSIGAHCLLMLERTSKYLEQHFHPAFLKLGEAAQACREAGVLSTDVVRALEELEDLARRTFWYFRDPKWQKDCAKFFELREEFPAIQAAAEVEAPEVDGAWFGP